MYKEKISSLLQERVQDTTITYLFVKTFLATLLPYPPEFLAKESEAIKDEMERIYKKFDFSALESNYEMFSCELNIIL